ncbi:vomeronasal type-2 receptor 26-like [Eleutherodactylus coqui]|uniref:vomeronasal type-2 receptor 26-like n=1 Tax=Eleutherodactylus coqui TaxID=57060 RepID=UPI0034620879
MAAISALANQLQDLVPVIRDLSARMVAQEQWALSQGQNAFTSPEPKTINKDLEALAHICKLLKFFGWTWVGIITSSDETGVRESRLLYKYMNDLEICVGFIVYESHRIYNLRTSVYQEHLETAQKQMVQVVILCGTYHDFVFESSIAEWLRSVTMILTPSWAPHIVLIEKYPQIFNGSLSIEPLSVVTTEFTHFLYDFYPLKYPKDLLLQNLWTTTFHCISGDLWKDKLYEWILQTSLHNCTGLEHIKGIWNNLSHEMIDPVYNAVILIANALNPIHLSLNDWLDNQTSYRYQRQFHETERDMISHNLKHLKYRGHAAINEDGELETEYQINNNIIVNGTWHKTTVCVFLPYTSRKDWIPINDSLIKWKTINNEVPKSRCTEPCPPGSRKVPGQGIHPCCHRCVPCSQGEISNESDSEICRRCPDHEWPNKNNTQCVPKLLEFLSYSDDVISAIVLSGSMLLLTLTAGILGIFISYKNTPVVRANNKNLSFVLLVSIMLSFLCVFLFLGRPVDGTCMLRQICTGILLSVSVSSLLAKTLMVCIAFKATKPGSVWRRWTGVKLPNCVLLICSSIQVVLCLSWVTFSPPFEELDTQSYMEKIIVQCNEGSDLCFYSVLGYMGILATVSFITAFLARILPDSFNEAKYITFSMLAFCSTWIAMIPAYLSTKGKYMVAVEIFAILTSNAGLLGCIFLQKCYIILFRPELNTRKHILEPTNAMLHQ